MAYSTSSAYTGSNEFSSGPYLACLAIVNASRASANSTSVSISGTFYLGFGSTTAYSGSTQGTGYANSATLSGNGVSSSVTVKSSSSTWTCAGGSAVKFNSNYSYTGKKPHLSSSGWSGTVSNWTSGNKSFTITVYENSTSLKTFTVTLACPTYYPTVTISYNSNGGTGTMSNTTYTYASSGTTSLRKNTYTKTGYYFYGWHRTQAQATAGNREYVDQQSWNLNNAGPTYNLYAAWKPNTYIVSYDGNNATSGTMEDSIATYDQNFITRQNAFVKTGYTFNGWNTAADGSGTEPWTLTSTGVYESGKGPWKWTYTSGRKLYAQWTVNSYTLTVNAGEGTLTATSGWEIVGNTATKTFNYGSSYGTLPTPTRTGYVFLGWYTSASGGTKVTSNTTMGDSNTEVFAHWTVAQYTVVYNANTGSGTAPNSQTFGYSESINLASSSGLTLSNYTANGWNTASGTNQSSNTHFDNGAVFNSASTTFNSNHSVTLYVHWVGASYTISYNANGGSGAPSSHSGNYGTSLTIQTTIPTRTNYYFKGWNTKRDGSGDTYQPGETYNKYLTVTLYAQWESNDFSIAFDSNYLQDYNVTRNQVAFGVEARDNAFNSHSTLSQGLYTTGIYVKSAILDNYGTGVLSGQLMASNLERALTKASYSSGIIGSINLSSTYTKNSITIPSGWHNYLYIPHRTGGNSGAAQSDNHNYGIMIMTGMTSDNGIYKIRYNSGIQSVEKFYTTLNKPTASDVNALSLTGGTLSGDLTLYKSSGNSPSLIFQRGTLTDSYNDWRIYDKSGYLYFGQRGSGSTDWPTSQEWSISTGGRFSGYIDWTHIGAFANSVDTSGIPVTPAMFTPKQIIQYKKDTDNSDALFKAIQYADDGTTEQCAVSLDAAVSNNHGVWSHTQGKWLAAYLSDGTPYFNDAALVDQIIEQGTKSTSGGVGASWTYRKWKSGYLEAWGWKNYSSIDYSTSAGTGYYKGIGTFYFPFTLAETPYCLVSADFANVGGVVTSSLSATSVYVSVWSASNTARGTKISVYIKGKYA